MAGVEMVREDTVLLSATYFGPIQYFTKFILYPNRLIEQFDHYSKQTFRNRCIICGANGSLTLSIPVLRGTSHKTLVRDTRIDYSREWQKLHWRGIESAYRHSPFFEFYMDDIRLFMETSYDFLLDLNLAILDYLLDTLEIAGKYSLTTAYVLSPPDRCKDARDTVHPKLDHSADGHFRPEPYAQVFSDRLGFLENLSVIDLLFNEGPNAPAILGKSILP
jgi:hypothetical protein